MVQKFHLGILDIMLLNAFIGWNLGAAITGSTRFSLKQNEFYTIVAERLLFFKEAVPNNLPAGMEMTAANQYLEGERHRAMQCLRKNARCSVCALETNMDPGKAGGVSVCSKCGCVTHNFIPVAVEGQHVHDIKEFDGLTCFESMHSKAGQAIWKTSNSGNGVSYSVMHGHPIVQAIRVRHGLPPRKKRKNPSTDDTSESQE